MTASIGPFAQIVLYPCAANPSQVANTIDFEGRGVVFVDYDDFEGEMKPATSE